MIAEESTAFKGLTAPLKEGGIGFDMKWHMGWMNSTLIYFQTKPQYRHYEHKLLVDELGYAFSERFMLSLSHDEVAK